VNSIDRLPVAYAKRIVLIDPDQPNPGCFNPLDGNGDAHLAVDNLVGIFAKIFQRHGGPVSTTPCGSPASP
jgi:hypothetical protein